MRKFLAAMGVILVAVAASAAPVGAQSRSVYWNKWDVTINNVDTGSNQFDVTESYDIRFSGSFRFGSAVIPQTNLERIEAVQVYQNGQALRANCSENPGTYCVENSSDGLSITYYFISPITDGSAQFDLQYTVVGALRVYDGGDQLWWTAIPAEHYGFPIGESTITVQMPSGYAPREGVDPVETYGAPAQVDVQGTTITANASGLSGDDYLELRVQYPHNPNARVASWQATFDTQRIYDETTKPLVDLGLIALSLLVGIGGLLAVYALWYSRGRDPKVGPVPEYLSEPPSDLPPAIVGTLLDEQADLRDVISTIVDLARRGYLVMEENQEEGLFGIGKTSKFVFKRTDKGLTGLRRFEQDMMNALFPGDKMERSMDSLTNHFYTYIPKLQNDLYDALVTEGLFTTKPSTTRTMWGGLGTLIFGAAIVLLFIGFGAVDNVSGAIMCVPMSLAVVGLAAMIVGRHMPAKTRLGAEQAAKWNAFREYLRNLEKYSGVEEASKHFDDYLAYATAFGIDRSWVRKFSQLQTVPIPTWYYPVYLGGPYRRGYIAGTPLSQTGIGGVNPGELARAGGGMSLDDVSGKIGGGLESHLRWIDQYAQFGVTRDDQPTPKQQQ